MLTSLKLYLFGILTGFFALLNGKIIIGFKRMLLPIEYWRVPAFSYTLEQYLYNSKSTLNILDIGSPKLLAVYIGFNHKCQIYATDLQDKGIWTTWNTYWNCLPETLKKGNYITEYQDARNLSYPDEYFDLVYSISVVEHIPDNGDTDAMKEISRVLKKNGKLIIEVPYSLRDYETFLNKNIYDRNYHGKPVFYERHYDANTLFNRLVIPVSHLYLKEMLVVGERLPISHLWQKMPKFIGIWFYWAEPFVSLFNHFKMDDWHIKNDSDHDKKRAMSVILLFEKYS